VIRWVRFDTAFPRNHKILVLVGQGDYRALVTFVCSLAYAGEQGTDGFIPREALPVVHGRLAEARKLEAVRLWLPEGGGWMINGWLEFQPSSKENEERTSRARAAALARWRRDN
jgi:hypothetical protein